jgi:hypothetical protein
VPAQVGVSGGLAGSKESHAFILSDSHHRGEGEARVW